MNITEKQAQRLEVQSRSRWSPYLEKCCLLLSANESYQRAEEDIEVLTGIKVSHGTQQRMVHRRTFEFSQVEQAIEEISLDGGKIRLRTTPGKPCEWRDAAHSRRPPLGGYEALLRQAVNLHLSSIGAFFQDNSRLVDWVNQQPLSNPLTCLGDGHPGIWNIFAQIGNQVQRREILDWYHLVENLGKVGGSNQRLDRAEALLWRGNLDGAIQEFSDWKHSNVERFVNYLNEHRERIINYDYFHAEGISIGSGAIESTIKQIGRRVKISGAQWKIENVPQVLRHRCAYLNGCLSS